MSWLALDIGGAQIKVADGRGLALSTAFQLWKHPDRLVDALSAILARCPDCDRLAVTMTGELADCYETKTDGVQHILEAVLQVARERQVVVYLTDGTLVAPDTALSEPYRAAASNWHALATFCGQYLTVAGDIGLLIDIGSTTTDLIPFGQERPMTRGNTDTQRLAARELVYTGVERSPVCAVVRHLPWGDGLCPVAQEVFATTVDAYLILGELPEDPNCVLTADGRPRTVVAARDRLARSICADRTTFDEKAARHAATAIRDAQLADLQRAAGQVLSRLEGHPAVVVVSGAGEFLQQLVSVLELARLRPALHLVSLSEELDTTISRCAPAHALARIATRLDCG